MHGTQTERILYNIYIIMVASLQRSCHVVCHMEKTRHMKEMKKYIAVAWCERKIQCACPIRQNIWEACFERTLAEISGGERVHIVHLNWHSERHAFVTVVVCRNEAEGRGRYSGGGSGVQCWMRLCVLCVFGWMAGLIVVRILSGQEILD